MKYPECHACYCLSSNEMTAQCRKCSDNPPAEILEGSSDMKNEGEVKELMPDKFEFLNVSEIK